MCTFAKKYWLFVIFIFNFNCMKNKNQPKTGNSKLDVKHFFCIQPINKNFHFCIDIWLIDWLSSKILLREMYYWSMYRQCRSCNKSLKISFCLVTNWSLGVKWSVKQQKNDEKMNFARNKKKIRSWKDTYKNKILF